jgi:hypothetical protein
MLPPAFFFAQAEREAKSSKIDLTSTFVEQYNFQRRF